MSHDPANSVFVRAIMFVLKHEGGYTNDPDDPGGETKYGISKRSFPDLDIANLTIDEARRIYEHDYWEKLSCSEMAPEVGMTVFGSAVNCGRRRATKWLQVAIRMFDYPIKVDGIVGPRTVAASKECEPLGLCMMFLHERLFYYACLGKKHPKYIRGWVARTSELMREIALLDLESRWKVEGGRLTANH